MERFLTHSTSGWRLLAAFVLGVLATAGCSKSPFDLAPVAGKVTIDGQPFAEGKVMFAPIAAGKSREAGRPAFGKLGADGSFTLGTYAPDDGAVVGEHWVTVIRIKPESETPEESGSAAVPASSRPAGERKFSRVAFPTKVTVVGGQDNVVDVPLTAQQVAQFGTFE
jgi:hypothetical protein